MKFLTIFLLLFGACFAVEIIDVFPQFYAGGTYKAVFSFNANQTMPYNLTINTSGSPVDVSSGAHCTETTGVFICEKNQTVGLNIVEVFFNFQFNTTTSNFTYSVLGNFEEGIVYPLTPPPIVTSSGGSSGGPSGSGGFWFANPRMTQPKEDQTETPDEKPKEVPKEEPQEEIPVVTPVEEPKKPTTQPADTLKPIETEDEGFVLPTGVLEFAFLVAVICFFTPIVILSVMKVRQDWKINKDLPSERMKTITQEKNKWGDDV